jgi:hypothetical protein
MDKPTFTNKSEEIKWMVENKEFLISQKKATNKHSDIIEFSPELTSKHSANKAESTDMLDPLLSVKAVINTTGLIDSHLDCHIEGIWSKSLKEQSYLLWLQEHECEFEYIIADSRNDELKASVKTMSWKDLGFNFDGNTQALIFDAKLNKERNEFMYKQYANGWVLNHSVGMRYVKLYLCVDSSELEYTQEKEAWDKYYPMVVNKEIADQKGYFWAVTEAKIIEGSAVVKGSNYATPTLSVSNKNNEAVNDTSKKEPSNDTQKRRRLV